MNMTDTIERLTRGIIGMINTRANIIAFTRKTEKYGFSSDNKSLLYEKAIYCVTLDRLMQEYEKEIS